MNLSTKTSIVFLLIAIIAGCSQDSSETSTTTKENLPNTTEKVSKPQLPGIGPGMYKVGLDIEAGEYVLIGNSAYFQVSKDSSGELTSIIANGMFNNRSILSVSDGQYLTVNNARIIPFDKAPKISLENGMLPEGTYKVGVDLPPGEYKAIANGSGYLEVAKNSKHTMHSIISNDNFESERYITIKNGQYITLQSVQLKISKGS